jgi:hypothetical protein
MNTRTAGIVAHTRLDLSSMEKSEVSKNLYGLIHWEEIMRSGVFLQHKDVRNFHFIDHKQQYMITLLSSFLSLFFLNNIFSINFWSVPSLI